LPNPPYPYVDELIDGSEQFTYQEIIPVFSLVRTISIKAPPSVAASNMISLSFTYSTKNPNISNI